MLETMSHKNKVFCLNTVTSSEDIRLRPNPKPSKQLPSTDIDLNVFKHVQTVQQLDVTSVAGGPNHNLFVTKEGVLFSSGKNHYGQLGRKSSGRRSVIGKVDGLENCKIIQAACGAYHSVAVSEEGHCFTWGNRDFGVLGRNSNGKSPGLIDGMMREKVVCVAAGYFHTIALTRSGKVYSWGKNTQGQLGHGKRKYVLTPTIIGSICNLDQPIAQIACGREHSALLTSLGDLYVWGKNTDGQLGTRDKKVVFKPTVFRIRQISKVCCGESFTVVLTKGRNPKIHMFGKIDTLSGVLKSSGEGVNYMACARNQVLLCTSNGQLILDIEKLQFTNVRFEDVNLEAITSPETLISKGDDVDKADNLITNCMRVVDVCSSSDNIFIVLSSEEITDDIGDVLLLDNTFLNWEMYQMIKDCLKEDTKLTTVKRYLVEIFLSTANLNGSFLDREAQVFGLKDTPYIDIELLSKLFHLLDSDTKNMICVGVKRLLNPSSWETLKSEDDLRVCFILPLLDEYLMDVPYYLFAEKLMSLSKEAFDIIDNWLRKAPKELIERWLTIFKREVVGILNGKKDGREIALFGILQKLKTSNDQSDVPIPCDRFYIPEIWEKINIVSDYRTFVNNKQNSQKQFCVCEYSFAFDLRCKHRLLLADAMFQMEVASQQSCSTWMLDFFMFGFLPPTDPGIVEFHIDREHIIADTLRAFEEHDLSDLKRPMRVKFKGEIGQDDGAIRKEYFLLLMQELMTDKYKLFTEKESKLLWFCQKGTITKNMLKSYELVGRMVGLGIYNNIILHLPFPLALFKKLLKKTVSLEDLVELEPAVGRMLQEVLCHKGDDLELYSLDFKEAVIGYENGDQVIVNLVSTSDNTSVTLENRQEYVNRCLEYVFDTSVLHQFNAFSKGFFQICNKDILEMFQPEEVFEIVKGSEVYNWEELEQICEYPDPSFGRAHPTVQFFWNCFGEMTDDEKKEFLRFLTGTHKIPFAGLKATSMIIEPFRYENREHEGDIDYLPEASTCVNALFLPPYDSKTLMCDKLKQALQSKGFLKL